MNLLNKINDFNVVIFGGRDFTDYPILKMACYNAFACFPLMNLFEEAVLISGTARGADTLGERFANHLGLPIRRFKPDWDKYKKRAGLIRNQEMADVAVLAIGFWDGSSTGTAHMINYCKKTETMLLVFDYKGKLVDSNVNKECIQRLSCTM